MSEWSSRLSVRVLTQSVGLAVWTVILVFKPCIDVLPVCLGVYTDSQFGNLNYLSGYLDNFCGCRDCLPGCH